MSHRTAIMIMMTMAIMKLSITKTKIHIHTEEVLLINYTIRNILTRTGKSATSKRISQPKDQTSISKIESDQLVREKMEGRLIHFKVSNFKLTNLNLEVSKNNNIDLGNLSIGKLTELALPIIKNQVSTTKML